MQSDWVVPMSWVMAASGTAACATLAAGISAPYGRYTRSGWGPMLNAKAAWIIQEVWSLAVPLALLLTTDRVVLSAALSPAKALLLAMFCTHYAYRSLVYPLRMRGSRPAPALVCLLAAIFTLYNGLLQGWWLLREAAPDGDSFATPRFVAGCALWAAGWAINLHADGTLRRLRKPGQTGGYFIPRGGLFEYVSAANFFGEIVEWTGWAVAARRLPGAAFAYFTVCNLAPRAWQHHGDYQQRFGAAYPQHRKALIPFVW